MDLHLKSVFDATANLNGARNGREIGRRLNTVLSAVEWPKTSFNQFFLVAKAKIAKPTTNAPAPTP
jgi:hypothetical protein